MLDPYLFDIDMKVSAISVDGLLACHWVPSNNKV